MAEKSAIEWTDATFNPWWGCAEVSPGCKNCYARSFAARLLPHHTTLWEPNGERRYFGEEHWSAPLRWERKAKKAGKRLRVFCASMADVFDNADELPPVREMLWDLIRRTPNLDWLILTKRIGNVSKMVPFGTIWPPNIWLGASVVNQDEADRDIPKLLMVPARVRFLSCEPLLGPIEFPLPCRDSVFWGGLDWVIVGGESGNRARPMEQQWAIDLIEQCRAAGTAAFMKQGSQANWDDFKNFESFPPSLQVRQWPSSTDIKEVKP